MINYSALLALGIDCSTGVSRCMGDSELYESVLRIFAANTGRITELQRSLAEKDYDALYEAVHDIKGVSANLSLTPLTIISTSLLTHLKNTEYDNLNEEIENLAACFFEIASVVNT